MVYHDTRRKFWRWPAATEKFLGTTLLLGAALLNVPWLVATTAALKFGFELSFTARFWSAVAPRRFHFFNSNELKRTRHLLTHELKRTYFLQLATLLLGGILLPFVNPIFAFALCLFSELLERHLFFVAVSPDRMPGSPK
jgi:hypothetical protein